MPSAKVSSRERLAELHERVDEGLALLVVLQLGDEGAVDLQRVDGEALEVSEGGVAGPEVIDRDPHAERLDLGEATDGVLDVAHQGGLGDLDRQRLRVQAAVGERALDVGDELVGVELAPGDVDGHPDRVPRGAPGGAL